MKSVLLLLACAAALPVKDKLHDLGLKVKELEKTWTGGGNLPGLNKPAAEKSSFKKVMFSAARRRSTSTPMPRPPKGMQ